MSKHVWVEIALPELTYPVRVLRIFRGKTVAFDSCGRIMLMDKAFAIHDIRHQLFLRSKGFCELCGDIVTEVSGQMHERKSRGKFGEISLENSAFVCSKTHKREHRDREPRFTRRPQ